MYKEQLGNLEQLARKHPEQMVPLTTTSFLVLLNQPTQNQATTVYNQYTSVLVPSHG